VEIGEEQGGAVSGLMREAGLAGIAVKKDLAGLDRVISARK
jgi:release factor glutamine methyltransferase